MAAYVSAGSGAWTTASTWTAGSGYPGSGGSTTDTFQIKDGHTVTLSGGVSLTVGGTLSYIGDNSGGSSSFGALVISDSGTTLNINVGSSGTNLFAIYGNLTVQSGATVSVGNTGGTARFHFYNSKTGGSTLTLDGSGGAINFGGSLGSKWYIDAASSFASITAKYCTFAYNGTGNYGLFVYGSESSVTIQNCSFVYMSQAVYCANALSASTNFTLTNSVFFFTVGTYDLIYVSGSTATGTRTISNNGFYASVQATGPYGWLNCTITNNVFGAGIAAATNQASFQSSQTASYAWTSFSYNLLRQPHVTANMVAWGSISNSVFFCDHAAGTDPNIIQIHPNQSPNTLTLQGNVFTSNSGNNNAALIYLATTFSPGSAKTASVLNNLVLPNLNASAVGSSGSLFSFHAPNNFSAIVEHNTACIDTGTAFLGMVFMGDQSTTPASNTLTSVQSNLGYSLNSTGSNNAILCALGSCTNYNVATPSAVGYNCVQSGTASASSASTTKTGYTATGSGVLFSSTPLADSTDVDQSPSFVSTTRTLATYYTSALGKTTTGNAAGNAQALVTYLATDATGSGVTVNSSAIANLISWLATGYSPQNTLLNTTYSGDTNAVTWIGAFNGVGATKMPAGRFVFSPPARKTPRPLVQDGCPPRATTSQFPARLRPKTVSKFLATLPNPLTPSGCPPRATAAQGPSRSQLKPPARPGARLPKPATLNTKPALATIAWWPGKNVATFVLRPAPRLPKPATLNTKPALATIAFSPFRVLLKSPRFTSARPGQKLFPGKSPAQAVTAVVPRRFVYVVSRRPGDTLD